MIKNFWRFSLFYDIFFEINLQLLAAIETYIIFLFQSFVKQMSVVIPEAAPQQVFFRKYYLIYTCYKCEEE